MAEQITDDGEIIQSGGSELRTEMLQPMEASIDGTETSMVLAKAEIDIQIATARRYPRPKPARIALAIKELAIMDEETAEECCYALVRTKRKVRRKRDDGSTEERDPTKRELIQGGAAVEGPSIRLAEIAAICWGNNRNGYRPVMIDRHEKIVIAEGVFLDLETNVATTSRVTRSIRTREGGIFQPDMIAVTMNAAGAIAKRNAILAGIPKGVTRPAYQAARAAIVGTLMALATNRQQAFKAFASYGVTPEMLLDKLGLDSEAEIGLDELAILRGMRAALKNGEDTVEAMFAPPRESVRSDGVADPLSEKEPAQAGKQDTPRQAPQKPIDGGPASQAVSQRETKDAAPSPLETAANGLAAETEPAQAETERRRTRSRKEEPEPGEPAASGQPNEPGEPARPTREADYGPYLGWFLVRCTTKTACSEVWKGQRSIRAGLGIAPEPYQLMVEARKAEIEAAEAGNEGAQS